MSRTDFLPRRQADLLTWSRTMRNHLLADPQGCGVTEQQAQEYAQTHDRVAAAYALAISPLTKGPKHTLEKDIAMKALRKLARTIVWQIQTQNVSTEKKVALGLTLRRPGGKNPRIPRPGAAPSVHLRIEDGRTLHIRLRDRERPHRRGMPEGVRGAFLFMFVGDVPPIDFGKWKVLGSMTRTDVKTVLSNRLEPGERVWIAAGWTNPRLERGPLSPPKCVRINFDAPPSADGKQHLSDLKRGPFRLAA